MRTVDETLVLQEQLAAIEEIAGCWSDEDHPELQTDEDIDRWLAELRSSWDVHLAAIGVWLPSLCQDRREQGRSG